VAAEAPLLIGRWGDDLIGSFRSISLTQKLLPTVSIEMHGNGILDANKTFKTLQ